MSAKIRDSLTAELTKVRIDLDYDLAEKSLTSQDIYSLGISAFLQVLVMFQKKCIRQKSRKGNRTSIPFHELLVSISPHYQRIFEVSSKIGIKNQLIKKSRDRFYSEFNPFSGQANVPKITSQMYLKALRAKKMAQKKELVRLLDYNFPVYHEHLHAIYAHLIPPKNGERLRDYFIFIEALTFCHESLIAKDVGISVSAALASCRVTYRDFLQSGFVDGPKFTKREFLTTFCGLLLQMHHKSLRGLKTKLNGNFIEIKGKQAIFKDQFLNGYSQSWLRKNEKLKYPEHLRKEKVSGLRKLNLKSFGCERILNDQKSQEKLWNWYRHTFLVKIN